MVWWENLHPTLESAYMATTVLMKTYSITSALLGGLKAGLACWESAKEEASGEKHWWDMKE